MRTLLLLFSFILIGCSNESKVVRLNDSIIGKSELAAKIQSLVDSSKVTGIAIAIFNNNETVFKKAFGYANYNNKIRLDTNQLFYGASLSKAVFGYLVATLVENGIIDLDKPLQEYLEIPIPELHFEKEWKGYKDLANDRRYEKITARMCLSHTTGFPNWRWINRVGEIQEDGKLQFYFDPGTQYSYSGEGIMLLQYVIEHITGKGLEQLTREQVFEPLHMNMTSYVWQDRFENIYVNGHTSNQETLPKDTEDEAGAAGSMETTLDDYEKFIKHILTLTAKNSAITSLIFEPNIAIHTKAQFGPLALELTNENDKIELNYGLGWGLLKSPYGYGAFKEGHSEGFQHYSIIFPDKQTGIIILSNSDNAESIFQELLEITIADTYTPWKWENYFPYR